MQLSSVNGPKWLKAAQTQSGKPGKPATEELGPSDQAELSGLSQSPTAKPKGRGVGWTDALGSGLVVYSLVALQSSPWLGGALLLASLFPLRERLTQAKEGLDSLGAMASQNLTGFIGGYIESMAESHRQEPPEGPERVLFRSQKILRNTERQFGKNSIYTLGSHLSLAEQHRDAYRGIDASEHYKKALGVFESELKERGEVESLHKLMPANLGEPEADAGSLYERAAEFFSLFGGPEKALPLLERAQELCRSDATFERKADLKRKLAETYLATGQESKGKELLSEGWSEALKEYEPGSKALLPACRAWARASKDEALQDVAHLLESEPNSVGLKMLGDAYRRAGLREPARRLANQSEILKLRQSSMQDQKPTPNLVKELKRLIDLSREEGDSVTLKQAEGRLAVIETRLAALGALLQD